MLLLLCVPAYTVAAPVRVKHKHQSKPVDDRMFVPTPDSLVFQNEAIDAMGLPRIRDDRQLRSLISENALVPVTQNQYVRISPKLEAKRRYVKPSVDAFLQELGQRYYAQFGEPIQVNSAVRTIKTQISLMRWNRNAAPIHGEKASAHLAGVAVDLQRRGLTPQQIRFIQQRLSAFVQSKMVIVEEELKQPCFHIVVTGDYASSPVPNFPLGMQSFDLLFPRPDQPRPPDGAEEPAKPREPVKTSSLEQRRETELQRKLCEDKELNCEYVTSLFADSRFELTVPPPSSPPPPTGEAQPRDRERNPYLARRFGLLTAESLERGRQFVAVHALTFDAAYTIYGVPKEVILGHLRIETDFGIATPRTRHPLGTAPAFNRLVTLYVHRSTTHNRQRFALTQLKDLIKAARANRWDLLAIPGSSTGAIGLLQFEPENFYIAVDGDGDGIIDLFDGDDAILSLAHFLYLHGFDDNPKHQEKAIYSYYGKDPHKYYMKAVLAYAGAEASYLAGNPIALKLMSLPETDFPLGMQLFDLLLLQDQKEPL